MPEHICQTCFSVIIIFVVDVVVTVSVPCQQSVGDVLDVDNAVEGAPTPAQSDVHFELDVHKNQATNKADSNDDQLGPERPFQITLTTTNRERGLQCSACACMCECVFVCLFVCLFVCVCVCMCVRLCVSFFLTIMLSLFSFCLRFFFRFLVACTQFYKSHFFAFLCIYSDLYL